MVVPSRPVPDGAQVSIAHPLTCSGGTTELLATGRPKKMSGLLQPACVIDSVCPAIVMLPVRTAPLVLGAMVMPTLSGPCPLVYSRVIQGTLLWAVQAQGSGNAMTSMRQSGELSGDSRG